MRQIKFRAWDKDKSQMVTPEIIGLDYERFIWCHDRSHLHNCQYWDGEDGFSDNFELMQYTGLKDKNGKEIYEGDILEFDPDEWGSTKGNRWAVEWDDEDGSWSTGGGTNRECRVWKKVIGNVFENPELLNQ